VAQGSIDEILVAIRITIRIRFFMIFLKDIYMKFLDRWVVIFTFFPIMLILMKYSSGIIVHGREAYRLHSDIVMSLEDILGYISPKTERIWTKRGTGMENGERMIL